jgi:hypothetical protein
MIYSLERRKTHPLDEALKHRPAVRYVTAEVRTASVRIALELLRSKQRMASSRTSPRSAGVIEAKTEHDCHHSIVGVSGHFGIVTISWDGDESMAQSLQARLSRLTESQTKGINKPPIVMKRVSMVQKWC